MKNQQFIADYVRRPWVAGRHGNLWRDGSGGLWNYSTCICRFCVTGEVVLNKTSYSPTTSKIQNIVAREVERGHGHLYNQGLLLTVDGLERGADLIYGEQALKILRDYQYPLGVGA
jgi:hypothetical protein